MPAHSTLPALQEATKKKVRNENSAQTLCSSQEHKLYKPMRSSLAW